MILGGKVFWFLLITLTHGSAWGDPHRNAAECRLSSELSEFCWNICVQCHEKTNPIVTLDIYDNGDVQICERCHSQQPIQETAAPRLGFVGGGGGNHPVAIYYSPKGSKTVLIPSPTGPKLFTDKGGNNPKIHCSTCHDSMSSSTALLRVNNRGSSLCRSCHIR